MAWLAGVRPLCPQGGGRARLALRRRRRRSNRQREVRRRAAPRRRWIPRELEPLSRGQPIPTNQILPLLEAGRHRRGAAAGEPYPLSHCHEYRQVLQHCCKVARRCCTGRSRRNTRNSVQQRAAENAIEKADPGSLDRADRTITTVWCAVPPLLSLNGRIAAPHRRLDLLLHRHGGR